MSRVRPEGFLEVFPELNIQCREIDRHGSGHYFGKIIWSFVLIGTSIMLFYNVFNLMQGHFSYRVTSTIDSEMEATKQFPDLVICAHNALNFTKMKSPPYSMSVALVYYLMSTFMFSDVEHDPSAQGVLYPNSIQNDGQKKAVSVGGRKIEEEYIKFKERIFGNPHTSTDRVINEFSIPPHMFGLKCKIRDTKFDCIQYNSTELPISSTGYFSGGLCFLIPSPGPKQNQSVPQRTGGWSVRMHRPKDANPSIYNLTTTSQFFEVHFAKIDDTRQGLLGTSPVVYSFDQYAGIGLTEKFVKKLPMPYTNCKTHESWQEDLKTSTYESPVYNMELCYKECDALQAMKHCPNQTDCIPLGFYGLSPTKLRICDVGNETQCMWNGIRKSECSKCSVPCEFRVWRKTVTLAKIPTRRQKFVQLEIFYEKMERDTIEEKESSTFSDLISSVGGQFALWIGFKISTMVQIIYYTFCFTVFRSCNPTGETSTEDQTSNQMAGNSYDRRGPEGPLTKTVSTSFILKSFAADLAGDGKYFAYKGDGITDD